MADVDKIDDLLKKLGIYLGKQRQQRYQLATKIATSGVRFDDKIAVALMQQAQRIGANNPAAMILSWIQEPSEIEAFVAEIESSREFAADLDPKAGRQEGSNIGGRLDLAGSDNPYGWSNPDQTLRSMKDVTSAGAWNPFRQSYNLEARQAQQHSRGSEYRRRRCSCLEIVGHSETKAERAENIKRWEQQPEWDPMEVERARGRYYGEPGDTGSVFGEDS